jgi:hypothetical protein
MLAAYGYSASSRGQMKYLFKQLKWDKKLIIDYLNLHRLVEVTIK